MRDSVFDFRKEYIEITNEVFQREQAGEKLDPVLLKADRLLEKYARFVQGVFSICICTLCGAEYWCKDVGNYCPTCGANVPEADQLNWTIDCADTRKEWAEHIWSEYKRRGDLPLMPKGTDMELLKMELKGYRDMLYKRVAQDHPRFEEIHREYLEKIKKIRWQIRELCNKTVVGPAEYIGGGVTVVPIKFNYRNTKAWKGK
jgi:hypothetical protein